MLTLTAALLSPASTHAQAPPAPTGLTATAGSGQVALSWNAASGASYYNLYRGTSPGGEGATPYQAPAPTPGPNSVYNGNNAFVVRPLQGQAPGTIITTGQTIKPAAYFSGTAANGTTFALSGNTNLVTVATAGDLPRIYLTRNSVSGLGYVVVTSTYVDSSGYTYTVPFVIRLAGLTDTNYTDTDVAGGTPYYYQVSAVGPDGTEGPRSSEVSATPGPAVLGVSNLTITPSTIVGGHSATATITLSSAAPQGGATVSLSTNNTTVVGIPSTVPIAQGQLTASFKVTTTGVASSASPNITASYNTSRVAALNVTPPPAFNTYAYVANMGSATVSVVDLATSNLVASIPVAAGPSAIAVSPNAAQVYVSCSSANSVSIIDTKTNSVVSTVSVGTNPKGIAVSPDGRTVVAVNSGAGTASIIDAATHFVLRTVFVGAQPNGATYSQDGRFIYVTNVMDNTVSVISVLTDRAVATIPVGNAPMGVTALPRGNSIYVANSGSSTISVIDPETQTVVQTIPVASGPTNLAGVADGTELYVTCPSGNTISVLDAVNGVLSQSLSVASQPTGVAVDSSGTLFVVTTQANAQVLVKDVDTNGTGLSAPTTVGNQPVAVAIATKGVPTPYLSQLSSNSATGGQLTILPNVSDATTDDPTMNYELYVDGILVSSSDTHNPALYWDTEAVTNGAHTLVLRVSTQNNTIGLSQPVTVTTSNVISKVALSLSTFDPEAPSNQLETVTGLISGGGGWTAQVQDGSGNTVASSSGNGATFSATWNGINQTTSTYADEGPYNFVISTANATSSGKAFAKSKKVGTSPPLVIVNGVNGIAEATQRAQLVMAAAKSTGTPYKYLIGPDFPTLAKLLKDPNCRYFYFNGHGGTDVNYHNPADGSVLDGLVTAKSAGYNDDAETNISLGGKSLKVLSHQAYWAAFHSMRGRTPHFFPTIASLGLRYKDQFRFVYLDGCDTGLAIGDGTHDTTSGINDMYDYFGLANAPVEDDGFYFGWKVTVSVPQSDPYSFFYWNTRYFNRVGGGKSFYTAFSETLQFSPVDQNIKDVTFGQGSGNATMHP